jgi:hypothetical protein
MYVHIHMYVLSIERNQFAMRKKTCDGQQLILNLKRQSVDKMTSLNAERRLRSKIWRRVKAWLAWETSFFLPFLLDTTTTLHFIFIPLSLIWKIKQHLPTTGRTRWRCLFSWFKALLHNSTRANFHNHVVTALLYLLSTLIYTWIYIARC